MNSQTTSSSVKGDEGESTPCMRTLSVKILAKCWENEYEEVRKSMAQVVMSRSQSPSSPDLKRFTLASARKHVAMSVMVLVANKTECGEELFLPFLSLRCQKELSSLRKKTAESSTGTEKEYYDSEYAAWDNILYVITPS